MENVKNAVSHNCEKLKNDCKTGSFTKNVIDLSVGMGSVGHGYMGYVYLTFMRCHPCLSVGRLLSCQVL